MHENVQQTMFFVEVCFVEVCFMDGLKRLLAVAGSIAISFFVVLVILISTVYNPESDSSGGMAFFVLFASVALAVVVGVIVNKKVKFRLEHKDLIKQEKAEKEKARDEYYNQKKEKKQEKQEQKEAKQIEYFEAKEAKKLDKMRQKALKDATGQLTLIEGLANLPQGSVCDIYYNQVRIKFVASGQDFNLDVSKLLDVSVMTSTQIQQQYVSSIGGAVVGAVLLGPLGAIIGGSAKKKNINSKTRYLVISYISNDETKYIVFDVTNNSVLGNQLEKKYKALKSYENVKVEL